MLPTFNVDANGSCFRAMISLFRISAAATACVRCYSKDFEIVRQGRMLDRMIKKSLNNRTNKESHTPKKLKSEFLLSAYDNEGMNRKTVSLNKFYMEHLMELINSGQYGTKINELEIEFSKVRISHCRSSLHVYWITNKLDVPKELLLETLNNLREQLQSKMGALRSMRKIPTIVFVKDSRLERTRHLEKLFEIADFGENSKPASSEKEIQPISEKGLQPLEVEPSSENILGVNHQMIKEDIEKKIRRFKLINIKNDEIEVKRYHPQFKLAKFDKKLFAKFYKQKMFLDHKLRIREYDEPLYELSEPYDAENLIELYWKASPLKMHFTEENIEKELEEYEKRYEEMCKNDDNFEKYDTENDLEDNEVQEREENVSGKN